VWHVSIARLSKRGDRLLKVDEWPNTVCEAAAILAARVLGGVGGTWELNETGDWAIHRRRRLSEEETRLLYSVRPDCPVFTHGEALKVVLSA